MSVFLDLPKAFDTVHHGRLLTILEGYGIRGITLHLFESYLSDRLQMVRLNNQTLSDQQKIKIGIPQGTVLGPILFVLYINSLLKLSINGLTISYADDTALVVSGDSWEDVKTKTIDCLTKVKIWL